MTETKMLVVNENRYFHQYSIREVASPFDFLSWLENQDAEQKAYFLSKDREFEAAASGCVLYLETVPHFEKANESPARFWGGQAFFPGIEAKDPLWDSFPRRAFFLPKYELIRKGNKILAYSHAINSPLVDEIDLLPTYLAETSSPLGEGIHTPASSEWKALIEKALQNRQFSKVVMARRTSFSSEKSLPPFATLAKITPQNAFLFGFQFSKGKTFVGATPEKLYQRVGTIIETEALAGTKKKGEAFEEKEQREFTLVKDSIQENLGPLCSTLTCEKKDQTVQTANAVHLYNPFKGELREGVKEQQVMEALHPTAAMGGLPKKSALEHLLFHEPFERGWYAAPLGYISAEKTEMIVGIRSALFDQSHVHLFVGAGIVEGSDAQKEWEELEQKTTLWTKVLK